MKLSAYRLIAVLSAILIPNANASKWYRYYRLKETDKKGNEYCIGIQNRNVMRGQRVIVEKCEKGRKTQRWSKPDAYGRIKSLLNKNLCFYAKEKRDAQHIRLESCNASTNPNDYNNVLTFSYDGNWRKYREIRFKGSKCKFVDKKGKKHSMDCNHFCLTYVGKSLDDGDALRTQHLENKICDESDDEVWACGWAKQLGIG